MTQHRRRVKQTRSLEDRLADKLGGSAKKPNCSPTDLYGDEALRRARQAEVGSYMSDWVRSPGLRAPK